MKVEVGFGRSSVNNHVVARSRLVAMGVDPKRVVAALAACLLIFFGASSRSWWTAAVGDDVAEVGLGDAIMCGELGCSDLELSELADFSVAPMITQVACGVAILACFAFLIGGRRLDRHPVGRIASATAVIPLVPLCLICVFFYSPGSDATLGKGMVATILGGALAFYVVIPTSARRSREGKVKIAELAGELVADETSSRRRRASQQPMTEVRRRMAALGETIDPTASLVTGAGLARRKRRTTRRIPDADLDAARKALRFVGSSCEISANGMTATFPDGSKRSIAWTDVDQVNARRLPPDPPFSGAIFVDLVIRDGQPIRIFGTTRVNYAALPGGAAHRSRDNLGKLGKYVGERNREATLEPSSEPFFTKAAHPHQFQAISQFVDYDAQFEEKEPKE